MDMSLLSASNTLTGYMEFEKPSKIYSLFTLKKKLVCLASREEWVPLA